MRRILDEQTYLDFDDSASLKVVSQYRAKYTWMDECLARNPEILLLAHADLASLSTSEGGREATYSCEMLFRALLVHQVESVSWRETVVRIAESMTLQKFVRLGGRSVMNFTLLNAAFKVIQPDTWASINEALTIYAAKKRGVDVSEIRADSTVVESNIHYPTDSSLLHDSYRVLTRLLRAVRKEAPELCLSRFHDRKFKKDLVYVNRYLRSKSCGRQRQVKRRFRRLLEAVRRVQGIAEDLLKEKGLSRNLTLVGLQNELRHYLPLTRQVCATAERAGLKGQKVPARDRIFSIFEEHVELIKRGKARKPVEFGHAVWLTQSPSKLITDYEVMDRQIDDSELREEITTRHKQHFGRYPQAVAADTGFRARAENMAAIEDRVETLAVPGRGKGHQQIEPYWHHFRAGIEGSISGLKRAFRLSVCMYRGFNSFAAAVGMAVFCHNLLNLMPEQASA